MTSARANGMNVHLLWILDFGRKQLFLALMNLEPTWNTYKSYEYISWQFTPYSIVTQKKNCSIVLQYPDSWHIFSQVLPQL